MSGERTAEFFSPVPEAVRCRGVCIKRAREEYEQAQNATHTPDTNETNVPPIVIPDDTGEETGKDDIILDVTDKDRTPDPGVTDVTIEYGTKEGVDNAE